MLFSLLSERLKTIIHFQQFDAYSFELMPPTPKTTPLFMTPPVTPPNESWLQQQLMQDGNGSKPVVLKFVTDKVCNLFSFESCSEQQSFQRSSVFGRHE